MICDILGYAYSTNLKNNNAKSWSLILQLIQVWTLYYVVVRLRRNEECLTSNQQNGQQHIRKESCEVDNLAGPPDALPDAEVAHDPHQQKGSS